MKTGVEFSNHLYQGNSLYVYLTIERQMKVLDKAKYLLDHFRCERNLVRLDADEFTEEEMAFAALHDQRIWQTLL